MISHRVLLQERPLGPSPEAVAQGPPELQPKSSDVQVWCWLNLSLSIAVSHDFVFEMNRSSDSQDHSRKQTPAKTVPLGARKLYLIFYNALSANLWAVILVRVVTILYLHGSRDVYDRVGEFTKWTQTLALLEVLHSLVGLVRAPILTTVMQVASRFLLVWGIANTFPNVPRSTFAYSTMLLAWSTTEVIRYTYFAVNITNGKVPRWLTWLRYNTFFVLYPMGISSECWQVWLATEPASKMDQKFECALWGVLAVYVPGSYILFTHMMAQRRKIMRGSTSKKMK